MCYMFSDLVCRSLLEQQRTPQSQCYHTFWEELEQDNLYCSIALAEQSCAAAILVQSDQS